MGSTPLRIHVIGWYDKGNIGDESYKIAFPILFPEAQLSFGEFPSDNVDVTILGGGDVASHRNLKFLRSSPGRKFIMSVCVNESAIKDDFVGVQHIVVRDQDSLERCKRMGLPATLAPDFASVIVGDKAAGQAHLRQVFTDNNLELYENVVAVVMNGHLACEGTPRQVSSFHKLAYDLADVADTTNASFVFLPFGSGLPWDDRIANGWIAAQTKFHRKNYVFFDLPNVRNTANLLAAVNAVISTRLHSSILSIASGTPFVDITHNHKNPALLKTVNAEDWGIHLTEFSYRKCHQLLNDQLCNPAAAKRVEKICADQLQQVWKVVKDVHLC